THRRRRRSRGCLWGSSGTRGPCNFRCSDHGAPPPSPQLCIRWRSVRETRGVERDTRRCSHCLSGNAPQAAAMYILLLS
ncbi:Uncharacterized protein FWK35_00009598, partial [Aphis craccivora]